MDLPEYLYHYTSVEALALILKNKTIRFNSIDKMDDEEEKEVADLKNSAQFVYASSWTSKSEESIPMWREYASMNLGVRIKMKVNPFKIYYNHADDIQDLLNVPVNEEKNSAGLPTIIPLRDTIIKHFTSPQMMKTDILNKIIYTDDWNLICPNIVSHNNDEVTIAFENLGKYKNTCWNYQQEWRYLFMAFPFLMIQDFEEAQKESALFLQKVLTDKEKQPFEFYDLTIDDDAYKEMEVTLSPGISYGGELIVNDLVKKYNPSCKLITSELKNKIKW